MSDNRKTVWEKISISEDVRKRMEEDDDFLLFRDVVFAREGVQTYSDGRALKDADELEKYAPSARGWAVVGGHPPEKILSRVDDIAGETLNPRFVKDLLCPKTGRRNIRGVKGDLRVWKNKVDELMLEDLRSGNKNDVSVGFLFDADDTPGIFKGDPYEYVQRNMFHNHLAYGIEKGRCPTPFCGLAADEVLAVNEDGLYDVSLTKEQVVFLKSLGDALPDVATDPLAGYENWDACIADQLEKGKSQESAEKICGSLEEKGEDELREEETVVEGDEVKTPCACMKEWQEKHPDAYAAMPDEIRELYKIEAPVEEIVEEVTEAPTETPIKEEVVEPVEVPEETVIDPKALLERAKATLTDPDLYE